MFTSLAEGSEIVSETPRWDRACEYIDAVLSGKQPIGVLARHAIERHMADLKRVDDDPNFPFVFSPLRAEFLLERMESLPHVEGRLAGTPLLLDPWQCFIFGCLNGWREEEFDELRGDYLRRFQTAYIEVPRKNGKSTSLAALGSFGLCCDGEPGAKVFSAASSSDQARIVFEIASGMLAQSDWPEQYGLDVQEHKIKSPDPLALFRPIASQTKSKDGKNPHFAIVDELHEHPDGDVWDSLNTALGARDHPLLIAITTAGSNVGGVCYEQRIYLEKILEGSLENERYFGIIYCADADDDHGSEETWRKANPALGLGKKIEYMRDQWNKAKANARERGEFLRKHLCIWTAIGAAAFDLDGWRRGMRLGLDWREVECEWVAVSVDMAIRNDLVAVVAVGQSSSEMFARVEHFATQSSIDRFEEVGKYFTEGAINLCGDTRINNEMIEDSIVEMIVATDAKIACFDPWAASGVMQHVESKLFEKGIVDVSLVEVRHRPMDMTQPLQLAQSFAEAGALVTDGDQVLYWMASNAIAQERGDFLHLTRRDETRKIDGIAALVAGCTFIDLDSVKPKKSIYSTRGVGSSMLEEVTPN